MNAFDLELIADIIMHATLLPTVGVAIAAYAFGYLSRYLSE